MLRFSHTAVGVQQGEALVVNALADDGPMWTGEGQRAERLAVRFPTAFLGVPVVQIGVSMWDVAVDANLRMDVAAEAVTPEGFTAVFRTWSDSRVARVRFSWLAIGPAEHVDDFEPE